MNCDKQTAMLRKVQEMEFVAIELALFLDTHPCDGDALNDFNCAAEILDKYKREYEEEFGPLLGFGMGGLSKNGWQWAQGPWPWEL